MTLPIVKEIQLFYFLSGYFQFEKEDTPLSHFENVISMKKQNNEIFQIQTSICPSVFTEVCVKVHNKRYVQVILCFVVSRQAWNGVD